MKKIFVVDTENVSNYSFIETFKLSRKDKIVLLTSKKSNRLSIEDFEKLHKSNATVEVEKVDIGTPNALDFQLVAYISLNLNNQSEYFIVSNDKGFDIFANYVSNKKDITINILRTETKKTTKIVDVVPVSKESISLFMNEHKIEIDKIVKSSNDKNELYKHLVQQFKDIGRDIYPIVKNRV